VRRSHCRCQGRGGSQTHHPAEQGTLHVLRCSTAVQFLRHCLVCARRPERANLHRCVICNRGTHFFFVCVCVRACVFVCVCLCMSVCVSVCPCLCRLLNSDARSLFDAASFSQQSVLPPLPAELWVMALSFLRAQEMLPPITGRADLSTETPPYRECSETPSDDEDGSGAPDW
jgi:hypothetical protein